MKKYLLLVLILVLAVSVCACGTQKTEEQAAQANQQASEAVAQQQSQAGVISGTVSHLSTYRMLVVEAGGNVYCFDIPVDTDITNMYAGNTVTVTFEGTLDPTLGTSYQNVKVTSIAFQVPPATPAPTVAPTAEPTPVPASEQAATKTAEGNAIVYLWSDGTMHDTPEAGQQAVTASQVSKIIFNEPTLYGPTNSCNGTITNIVEDGKYIVLDDGINHQFMFYIGDAPQMTYDGTGVQVGANCSVMYIGTLNPNYGASTPQFVDVQNVQTDSKAYYYNSIRPKTTTTPRPAGGNSWYGTDGKIHWYGADGKIYNYDSKGNIVLS